MAGGIGFMVTTAEPFMVLVHPVVVLRAVTVYVPAV